jgi:hypothetical protein
VPGRENRATSVYQTVLKCRRGVKKSKRTEIQCFQRRGNAFQFLDRPKTVQKDCLRHSEQSRRWKGSCEEVRLTMAPMLFALVMFDKF